jgi:hypothetical protein
VVVAAVASQSTQVLLGDREAVVLEAQLFHDLFQQAGRMGQLEQQEPLTRVVVVVVEEVVSPVVDRVGPVVLVLLLFDFQQRISKPKHQEGQMKYTIKPAGGSGRVIIRWLT